MPRIHCVLAMSALLVWGCGSSGGSDPVDPPDPPDPPPAGTGSISGSVQDIMGAGIGNVTVSLTGAADRNAQTAGSGAFQFTNLEPGSYTVTVAPPSGFVVALGASSSETVSVSTGGTVEVHFQLATEADANVAVVRLQGLTFVPADITIPAGATIRWRATETLFHTVTPDGHSEWAEYPLNNPGDIFEHTFSGAGNFDYYCDPHRADGMTGVIRVTQ